jgi:ABC-type dipeptide/oligopeptide/nickel transport system permease subunit
MGLRQYFIKRVLDSIVVMLLILSLNFFLFYRPRPEVVELSVLDQVTSYLRFIFVDAFRTTSGEDLIPTIMNNLPFTMSFWGISIAVTIALSILIGTIAAYKFHSKINSFFTVLLASLFLIPSWWLGTVFQKYLSPFFPITNWYSIGIWAYVSPWTNPLGFAQDFLWHMVLPITCLTLSLLGVFFLVVRNSMLGLKNEDFVTLLRAKGVSSRKILFKHLFRNAILPITALAALTPLIMINAAVTIERVFTLPGIGYSLYRSMISATGWEREVPSPTLQVIFLALAFIMVAFQFIFDIAHHSLDPRLRIDGGQVSFVKKARRRRIKDFWKRYMKRKSGIIGLAIIIFFVLVAVLAPILPMYGPEDRVIFNEATPPSFQNLLGTDDWGRDVLSRVIWGTRTSLLEFFGALSISLVIGCFIGLLSGYYSGKWFSYILDRITDVFISIPLLIFVVFFPLEPGYLKWILSVGVATWGITAKIARSQVLTIREKAYIEAAKSSGAKDKYIIFRYVLPEAFPVIASSMIYTAALIISLQSTLDFFGFRLNLGSAIDAVRGPNVITWGSLMYFGKSAFYVGNAWWIPIPPAICMALLGLSIVFVADAIAYASSPRLEEYTEKKTSMAGRLYNKMKKHRLISGVFVAIIILAVALVIIPTPHARTRTETASDFEKWIGCWGTLTDGKTYDWDLANLSITIRVIVNVSSTEDVRIRITSSEGEVSNILQTQHNYTLNATGPYLHASIENPTSQSGLPAIMSGDIEIRHYYETQTSYIEWLPWWEP